MERPLLLPLVALMAGIYSAGSLDLQILPWLPALLLALAMPAIFLSRRFPLVLLLLALLFCWGNLALHPLLNGQTSFFAQLGRLAEEKLVVEGVVARRPETSDEGCRMLVRVEQVQAGQALLPLAGTVQLKVKQGMTTLLTGDRVRFNARLTQPRTYGLPGEFDYPRYLLFKGVQATAFVQDASELLLIRAAVAYPWQRWIDGQARSIGTFIRHALPGVEGGVVQALLIGDTGLIPRELKDAYSRTGVNHILSISGFHVGIIALFLVQLLYLLSRVSPAFLLQVNARRFGQFLVLPAVVYYLFLAGAAPATVRSVLMLGAVFVTLMLEREVDPVNSLLLAASAILLLNPAALYDLSFQFSFLALWGLLVLTPLFMAPIAAVEGKMSRALLLFLGASLAATLATMIPVAYYFHQVSLTGLLSNFLIVPLLGYGVVVAGFVALPFIVLAPAVANLLFSLCGVLVLMADFCIALLDRIPVVPVYGVHSWQIWILLFVLTAVTITRRNVLKATWCCCALLLCLAPQLMANGEKPGSFRLDSLSVGQGESTLVTFPDGRRMLIDGGGSLWEDGFDVGTRLLLPALRTLGVERLDYVMLSHPHPDHLLGLRAVVAALPVGEFWESGIGGSDDYRAFKRLLAERQVPVRRVNGATPPLSIGPVTVRFLHPQPLTDRAGTVDFANLNEESLVMRLEYGATTVLFTGDIGVSTEQVLLRRPELLRCSVLKVPHHGSRHSCLPEFFRAAAPAIALISAGYRNSFHLPAAATLAELDRQGCAVYRTDLDGTVTLVVDSHNASPRVTTIKGHFR